MKKTILTTVISLFVTISAFAYSGGNGTEQNPYLISSKADMQELATNVNGGQKYANIYFLLTRDLTGKNDTITTIIGNSNTRYFSGNFDGGEHEIAVNISISDSYAGTFGYLSSATIKNLGVAGSVIKVGGNGTLTAYVGSVCGYMASGTIANCYNVGKNILAWTQSSKLGSYSGGICGYVASGTIINCYNTGNIGSQSSTFLNSYSYSGGICGYLSGTITNCYNTGNIASYSDSNSSLTVSGYSYSYSGGICGYAETSTNSTISNCYNIGNIFSSHLYTPDDRAILQHFSGGICGRYGIIQNCFVSNCQIKNTDNPTQSMIGRIGGSGGSYSNCYTDISVSLNGNAIANQDENSKNGKDILVANLQDQSWLSSVLQWDFDTVWKIKPNEYPSLIKPSIINLVLPVITYGDQVSLAATSDNNIVPIVYESSDNSIAEITGSLLIAKKAGTVIITASQPATTGFLSAKTDTTITIQKKGVIITANSINSIYGDAMPQYTSQYSGFVLGDNESILTKLPTFTCSATSQSNAGTYNIVPSGAEATNYTFTYANGTLTIDKRNLQVLPNNASRIYGYANPSFSLSYNGFINADNDSKITTKPSTATTATLTSNAGDYPITCSGGSATNYSFTYETGTLTITKAPLTVCVSNSSRLYGATNPSFTINYSGFRNGETQAVLAVQPQAVCLATPASDVSSYPIIISGGTSTNYDFSYINGTLTITKASLTITAENKSREQGQSNPEFTLAYSGFKNNENASVLNVLPTISCAANINSPAGFYDIVLSGGSDNNYQYTLVNGHLEVTVKTGIETVESNNIKIYPNPVKENFRIDGITENSIVTLLNATGKIVWSRRINPNEIISTLNLPKGTYIVCVADTTIKIIKQ